MPKTEATLHELEQANIDGRSTRHAGTRKARKPSSGRMAWAGGLKDEELNRPGAALLSMLLQTANDRGQQLNEMATELDVTYGYIAQLRNGIRDVRNISDDFAEACAEYLGIPRIAVLAAAGKLNVMDLYDKGHANALLDPALKFIQNDGLLGKLMPADIFQASDELKLFVVNLYEKLTGRTLIAGRVTSMDELIELGKPLQPKKAAVKADQETA